MKPQNPFLLAGYYSPEYFCDRTSETARIIEALINDRNVTLIAPRRMGKTGLIKNVFYNLGQQDKEVVTLYIDIYSTQNLTDFVQVFATNVLGQLEGSTAKTLERIGMFFKSLHPVFSFNELTGTPKVTIDIIPNQEEATLKDIFEYIKQSGKRCYIAIDEFQQVAEYPERGVEALLRSYIQFIPNARFIFSGSKQHLMQDMFLSAKRPFYQSTQTMSIDAIEKGEYYAFASRFFGEIKKEISVEVFDALYADFSGHTWYIQSILNRLYGYKHIVDRELLQYAVKEIVSENEFPYQNLLLSQKSGAIKLLKAIAKESIVAEINAGDFITKYGLKAASSVNSSLKKLIDKELVYKTLEGYTIYDRFMAIWLKNL